MSSLRPRVQALIELVTQGRTVEAMERFYASDVVVFENRELARAGRDKCITYEKAQLARMPEPPTFKALRFAVDEQSGTVFIEWRIRFRSPSGRLLRLEEVAVQKWALDEISEERFYYEGLVDEGEADEGG